MKNELLKIDEVASILRVDKRTILNYKNLEDDPLPSIKLKGLLLFRLDAVMDWLKRRENNTGAVSKDDEATRKSDSGIKGQEKEITPQE